MLFFAVMDCCVVLLKYATYPFCASENLNFCKNFQIVNFGIANLQLSRVGNTIRLHCFQTFPVLKLVVVFIIGLFRTGIFGHSLLNHSSDLNPPWFNKQSGCSSTGVLCVLQKYQLDHLKHIQILQGSAQLGWGHLCDMYVIFKRCNQCLDNYKNLGKLRKWGNWMRPYSKYFHTRFSGCVCL